MEKARRSYDSPGRRAQAAATRARIIDAAARLFVRQGYAATRIPDIAAEAGVAVETVYRAAAGKAGLLADAVRAAVAGGSQRAEVPVPERAVVRRIHDEPDPERQLALYARTQPGIWSRVGSLMQVLDAAADIDPALAELGRQLAGERHRGLRSGLAQLLEQRGALRPGLTADRAGDMMYAVCGRATYEALVNECGWTHDEYCSWITQTLTASLLGPSPDHQRS